MTEAIKVLIVDDEELFARSIADILTMTGYAAEHVTNGEDAVMKCKGKSFDVILMDIKLPGMNGVETYKKMKEVQSDVAVIMITGFAIETIIQEGLKEGAVGVMYKPLDIDKLIDMINVAKAKQSGKLVLIADGDEHSITPIKDVLRQKGFKVLYAKDGKEALELSRSADVDVLFADVKLSFMGGIKLYRAISEFKPDIIAILMFSTDFDEERLAYEALTEGVYACLSKPVDTQKLLDIVGKINEGKA